MAKAAAEHDGTALWKAMQPPEGVGDRPGWRLETVREQADMLATAYRLPDDVGRHRIEQTVELPQLADVRMRALAVDLLFEARRTGSWSASPVEEALIDVLQHPELRLALPTMLAMAIAQASQGRSV
ncbi:hypothetical protein [Streptacidiphilus sp. EB103A]|uniref:hypothetical protein n=1 Tax=Streptacidiphilus sp. EB103A TaxID=3156275 RepID=UPI0035141FBB